MQSILSQPAGQSPPHRIPVVVTIEPDGFVRVFAPTHVDVRFVGILDTLPECRTDAETYAALALPRSHREIAFDARYSRGVFMSSPRTTEQEINRAIALRLVKECRR